MNLMMLLEMAHESHGERRALTSDAAVVGIADEQWGEAVAAAVALRPGATGDNALHDALCEHVRGALRSSRVPTRIEFRDSLPYNETGKLLRREVRGWLTKAES